MLDLFGIAKNLSLSHVHDGGRYRQTDDRRQAARASAGARLPKWRQSGALEAAYSNGRGGHRAVYRSAAEKRVDESTAVYQVYR